MINESVGTFADTAACDAAMVASSFTYYSGLVYQNSTDGKMYMNQSGVSGDWVAMGGGGGLTMPDKTSEYYTVDEI